MSRLAGSVKQRGHICVRVCTCLTTVSVTDVLSATSIYRLSAWALFIQAEHFGVASDVFSVIQMQGEDEVAPGPCNCC